MQIKKIVNFLYEVGVMKREKHSGFLTIGVKDPDSLADHTTRAAVIGYILAEMEQVDPYKVTTMLVIHDLGEIRVRDQHKLAARYFDIDKAEQDAFNDQANSLPEEIGKEWKSMFQEFNQRNTREGIVAKDADWLETAISAQEYLEQGYKGVESWLENVGKALQTDSARKLFMEMRKQNSYDWMQGLKKMTYKEIYK